HRASLDAAAVVDSLRLAGKRVRDRDRPDAIAVALDDRGRGAVLEHLVRVQRRVDAAVNHVRAARLRRAPDFVAAQRVQRVNADADDVARLDLVEIDLLERLVNDVRIAVLGGRRRREYIQPTGCNDSDAKRNVAWIDQVNSHQESGWPAWHALGTAG